MTTKATEDHELKDIMRAKHDAKACGWGCQFCKDEGEEKGNPEQALVVQMPIADLQQWLDSDYARPLEVQAYTPYHDLNLDERHDLEEQAQLIIDTYETDVTMGQVQGWDDYDLQDWLAAWEEE